MCREQMKQTRTSEDKWGTLIPQTSWKDGDGEGERTNDLEEESLLTDRQLRGHLWVSIKRVKNLLLCCPAPGSN
jgi:hypothetical protein